MRALIPCGGRGTRMLGVTAGAPKELMIVAGRAAIDCVLSECAESGVTDALVVVSPDKRALVEHVHGLEDDLPRCHIAVQHEPRGLADAIRLGRDFAAGHPLAVALPDNLFDAPVPALAQVRDTFDRQGVSTVAVVEIAAAEASHRGATGVVRGELEGDVCYFSEIPDKGERHATFDTGGARSAFTSVGRYIFVPDVFAEIDSVERRLPAGAELDDVPVMQSLLARHALVGRRIDGRFFDIGVPDGYREACAAFPRSPSTRQPR